MVATPYYNEILITIFLLLSLFFSCPSVQSVYVLSFLYKQQGLKNKYLLCLYEQKKLNIVERQTLRHCSVPAIMAH